MLEPDWLTEEIFIVAEVLSPEKCAALIARAEEIGFEEATLTSPEGPVRVEAVRDNDRVIVDDEALAAELWELLEELVPVQVEGMRAVGINERFRFYRYEPGQQFDWHQDHSFERDNGEVSHLTVLIYLNDDFEGGETAFDDTGSEDSFEPFEVTPEIGLGLFFLHQVHHKGEPVLSGRKYVLRTDVMYAPRRRRMKKRRREEDGDRFDAIRE
jgi:predicted 2-oxoglutarate/Fe(II)-dependent dioxygenase YbiX